MYVLRYYIFILLMLLSNSAITVPANKDLFNAELAQRQLDQISIDVIKEGTELTTLEKAYEQLRIIHTQAEQCVKSTLEQQIRLQTELDSIQQTDVRDPVERDYLNGKLDEVTQILSQCRIAKLRADDLISAVSTRLERQFISKLFTYQHPLWVVLSDATTEFNDYWTGFTLKQLQENSDIDYFNTLIISIWIGIIIIGLFCGFLLHHALNHNHTDNKERKFFPQVLQVSKRFCRRHAVWFPALLFSCIYLSFLSLLEQRWLTPTLLSYALLAYVFFSFLLRLIFYPIQPAKPLFAIPKVLGRRLIYQLHSIALVLLLCFSGWLFLVIPEVNSTLFVAGRSLLLLFLALQGIALLITFAQLPYFRVIHTYATFIITTLFGLILIFTIIADWLGLHYLAWHVLIAFFTTIGATLIIWVTHQFLSAILSIFNVGSTLLQKHTRKFFGVKSSDGLAEIFTLRLALEIILWGSWILILLKAWGLPQTDYHDLITKIINGFHLGGLVIYPLRIVLALLTFSVLILLIRALKARFIKIHHPHISYNRETTIAIILAYIGVAVAIVAALLVAGVNFTGLAIIAGALSVGIGLGLQNTANNFFSGIILLLERPIKIGDRIIIGDIEGFVKNISIRATEIRSLDKSDIIVPNSELTSNKITNLMFKDFKWRVEIPIGVAYGSDTALVKRLLLQAASEHPDVINDDPDNKSLVLFWEFGDNSLVFMLYCIINDVNKKYIVPSELHFTIDKLFREHDVTIAFPQRDLYIKQWPGINDKQ